MNASKRIFINIMRHTSLSFRGISRLLIVSLSLVHIAIALIFGINGINMLVISDLICVAIYMIFGSILVKKEKHFLFLTIVYLTIQLHSLFACIYLGWTYGFSLYCMCVIPISFLLFYLCDEQKNHLKFVIVLNSFSLVCTLAARMWVYSNGSILPNTHNLTLLVSSFNMFVCGVMVILFSSLFVYQLSYTDMELEKRTKTLDFLANYDTLTRLRNRRNLETILKKEIQYRKNKDKKQSLCVALGDIDDFKKINDTYGHDCGDMVLVRLSEIFRENVGEGNFVARWGGEEILFVFQCTLAESRALLEHIRMQICEYTFTYDDKEFRVSMTFGLVEMNKKMNADELLIKVDEKMYEGKKSGKNRIII